MKDVPRKVGVAVLCAAGVAATAIQVGDRLVRWGLWESRPR